MRTKTLEQNSADALAGLQIDLLSKMRAGNMTFEQIKWFNNLSFGEREKLMGKEPEKVIILKLLSGGKKILLDACDGKEIITNAKDVFLSGIHGDLKNWNTNKLGIATKETEVRVHEMLQNANFAQMFGFLETDLDKLCLTQAQIINFCKKHFSWLRKRGQGTFFLFKVEDQFLVAYVRVCSDVLRMNVYKFMYDIVWNAMYEHRLVVPQMNP